MTDSVKEQLSACLDGELPRGELDLLLKRLERDPQLRHSIGRYSLLGEVMRAGRPVAASMGFADKVSAAIDADPALGPAGAPVRKFAGRAAAGRGFGRWLQPIAGLAVAAGVAALAVLAFQPSTSLPPEQVAVNTPSAASVPAVQSRTPGSSYTVPTNTTSDAYIPAARLTNYVVAHSEYSSPLSRRTVLSGVLSDDEDTVAVSGSGDSTESPEQTTETADEAVPAPVEKR
jgi:sigma-E factor negative regulatory protein RseA